MSPSCWQILRVRPSAELRPARASKNRHSGIPHRAEPERLSPRGATATRRFGTHQRSDSANPLVSLFQGQLIPGLLQTPEYASSVFSLPPALPDETRARTVAARMERQATLYEDGRSFHFVICEHVLSGRLRRFFGG
ncbi:Scr1 family TA system antitoxin-like transcriptional regulator [Streptomyces sp. NPDC005355]|uniref:Scr1 family TA system antitoxin-like transcriptional regulator n=1 Tax=Streptomyces sp. NPDC005355 TaxID=3157038 RepID=UPI0033B679E1